MEILVTTTESIQGMIISRYFGPITSNIVIGTNIINDLFASVTDVVGGRSVVYQEKFKEMYTNAIEELKNEAKEKNANCILGLKIDIDQLSGKGMQMFMLNAIGTAVFIETEKQVDERMQNEILNEIEIREKNEELAKRIKEKTDLINDPDIMAKANEIKRMYG